MLEQTEDDLEIAFRSASSLLSINAREFDIKFEKFAGLKAEVQANFFGRKITARISDGYKAASQEVLIGLALSMLSKVYRKKINSNHFVLEYKEFISRESTASLSNSLRVLRGRKRRESAQGTFHDLSRSLEKITLHYPDVFENVAKPRIVWGKGDSKRRLAFHDPAFNEIVVSKAFDSAKVPEFVVDYLVFHELLHCKHDVKYQRGKSLRRTVHSTEFKQDEKRYAFYNDAEEWIRRNLGRLD